MALRKSTKINIDLMTRYRGKMMFGICDTIIIVASK